MRGQSHWLQSFTARCSAAALGAALISIAFADEAWARSKTSNNTRPKARASADVPRKPAQRPHDSLLAVVSIAKQRITVYGAQGILGHSPISSGKPGHATPTGVFTVLQKNKFHRSNIYSGAPMPYMQRLTWSGIALHAGALPGYPASHGCIRMPMGFAQEFWRMTRMGARVVVVPDEAQPQAVAHARLPSPTLFPAPADTATTATGVRTAAAETSERTDASPPATALDPIAWARLRRAPLAADAAAKADEAKTLAALATEKAREANLAIKAMTKAERTIAEASARRAAIEAHIARLERRRPTLAGKWRERLQEQDERAERTRLDLPALEERANAANADAFAASEKAWAAERAKEKAAIAAKSAEKTAAGDPISILVSRKTRRVQVRQGWETLLDAPAVFNGTEPIGTHVYVALEPAAGGDGLRWTSVSFNGSGPPPEVRTRGRRQALPPAAPRSMETAESVLERFEIDAGSRAFIAERLWTGATLIVSDEGPSHETGKTTDFVILTR